MSVRQFNESFMMPLLVLAVTGVVTMLYQLNQTYSQINEKLGVTTAKLEQIISVVKDHEQRLREMEFIK